MQQEGAVTVTLGTVLAGLLMLAEQGGSTPGYGSPGTPKYHRYDFESACAGSVFRVRFRNGPTGRSRVDRLLIDGRPVPGAARSLDRFAARRAIKKIGIMNCGKDTQHPLFRGIMELSKPESQPFTKQNTLFFRVIRQGKGWQFSVD